MVKVFGGKNLMCIFHVKQAVRKWVFAHARLDLEGKTSLWAKVNEDINIMQLAQSEQDFRARAEAVLQGWALSGTAAATAHKDKKGRATDLLKYFRSEWLRQRPEWHHGVGDGRVLPTTNNAAEAAVKYARIESGGTVTSIADNIKFLRRMVRSHSMDTWAPQTEKQVGVGLWRRAQTFSFVMRSKLVFRRLAPGGQSAMFTCWGRRSPDNVKDRRQMRPDAARRVLDVFKKLQGGQAVKYTELHEFSQARVFYKDSASGKHVCTCPAFPQWKRCLHTIALDLRSGQRVLPTEADSTPVAQAVRGRKRKAGGRRAGPEDPVGRAGPQGLISAVPALHPRTRLRCKATVG